MAVAIDQLIRSIDAFCCLIVVRIVGWEQEGGIRAWSFFCCGTHWHVFALSWNISRLVAAVNHISGYRRSKIASFVHYNSHNLASTTIECIL